MEAVAKPALLRLPPVGGIDMSITHDVVLLWIAAAVTFGVLFAVCRRREPVARGTFRNLMEGLIDIIDDQVIAQNLGAGGRAWGPFLLTVFFFILFANLMGMVPLPGYAHSVTGNLSVTAGLAAIVFLTTLGASLRHKGVAGFFRSFAPAGVPKWVYVLVVPIEVISWLAKPVSLAVRLFANMVAGHSLLFVFIGLEMTTAWLLKPLPLIGAVAMGCFELFVMLIQAFIFALLAGMYIKEAVTEAD